MLTKLWKKYGLSVNVGSSPHAEEHHDLVCRYMEEHPHNPALWNKAGELRYFIALSLAKKWLASSGRDLVRLRARPGS